MTTRTKYDVIRSDDGQVIGRVDLTNEEWDEYRTLAEQNQNQVRLAAIPHAMFNLHEHWQHLSPETSVHLK